MGYIIILISLFFNVENLFKIGFVVVVVLYIKGWVSVVFSKGYLGLYFFFENFIIEFVFCFRCGF